MTAPPRRVNFVDGQLLSADDLRTEQDYHRSMRHLQNRLHGHGVVQGFEVAITANGVVISPGIAIDAQGRELVLTEPIRIDITGRTDDSDVLVVWAQTPGRTSPRPDSEPVVTLWIERPEGVVVPSGQGPPDAVLLAHLAVSGRGEATLDPSVRRWHPSAGRAAPGRR